jgi:hypothetical protein
MRYSFAIKPFALVVGNDCVFRCLLETFPLFWRTESLQWVSCVKFRISRLLFVRIGNGEKTQRLHGILEQLENSAPRIIDFGVRTREIHIFCLADGILRKCSLLIGPRERPLYLLKLPLREHRVDRQQRVVLSRPCQAGNGHEATVAALN